PGVVDRALQLADGNGASLFRRQVWGWQISVAIARHRYRHCPDSGWLPMDGGHDHAGALLFFSGKTAAHFPHHHGRLQSTISLAPIVIVFLFLFLIEICSPEMTA